jgi:hypothetical protein
VAAILDAGVWYVTCGHRSMTTLDVFDGVAHRTDPTVVEWTPPSTPVDTNPAPERV